MARWDGIEEFLEVVEAGSFTAAATRLGVSKSYISKQISALEDRFGARLLQRTTRQLTLTGVGEVFFQQCQQMAQQLADAETMISELQHEPLGTLKIALNSSYGVQYMATAVARFAQLHPQLTVEVSANYHDVDLLAEGYDLAIRYGELADSNLIARRLGPHSMCLCASPEYFAAHGVPRRIEDLRTHNCLVGAQRHWQFTQGDSSIRVKVDGNWISEDGATHLAAARCGIGLAQLPDFFVQADVEQGNLLRVEADWAVYERVAWAVYPHSRHISTKVRLFIDFVTDYMENRFPALPNVVYNRLQSR